MSITRRDLLAGAAAAALAPCPIVAQPQPAAGRARVIDAHTHWYPAEWIDLVVKEGPAAGARIGTNARGAVTFAVEGISAVFGPTYSEIEGRIRAMDAVGVDTHVLSLMAPMVFWAPPELGARLSQTFNDAAAAAHAQFPERLVGLAMLPMQAPELALAELERASKLPGLRGVMTATEINGKNLDDKAYFPIYARCEELGWPIFPHPINPVGAERMSRYYLRNLLGNPVEIGIAGYSLILGGVLDAFPRLDVMLPRAGGNVPWGIGRLDRTVERMPERAQAKRPASQYLRRFHYDCIIESADILMDLIRLVGADRVVFGTDYASPMRDAHPTEFIRDLDLAPADRDLILGGNAARLFKI